MTITEVLERAPLTNYKGSELTCKAVGDEITRRYGPKIAKQYDPRRNCRTYVGWTSLDLNQEKVRSQSLVLLISRRKTHLVK